MGGDTADLMRALYAVWNGGDVDEFLTRCHPDVHYETSGYFPDFEPVYEGREGMRRFWDHLRDPWEHFDIELEDEEELGGGVVGHVRFRARGKGSGVETDLSFFHAARFTDGLLTELYSTRTAEGGRAALARPAVAPAERGSA